MKCDKCFNNECLMAVIKKYDNFSKEINYEKQLGDSVECGDNIVEYDKGEECDGASEGCDPKTCKALKGYICFSPVLGNSRCLKC